MNRWLMSPLQLHLKSNCQGHQIFLRPTGFSRAAPATLQCLRWPYWVLKRSACRASTFKMAVLCSQALHLPHFNLYDGRTEFSSAAPPRLNFEDGRIGFSSTAPAALQPLRWPYGVSSAAPVTQTNGICRIIVQTKNPTKPTALWREHDLGVAGQTV